jgi:hypothetical protein
MSISRTGEQEEIVDGVRREQDEMDLGGVRSMMLQSLPIMKRCIMYYELVATG